MHAYTYIHTYIHTDTHTYIHTYIHTYRHTYIHTYIHEEIHLPGCRRRLIVSEQIFFKLYRYVRPIGRFFLEFGIQTISVWTMFNLCNSNWDAEANILAQTAGVPSIPWSGEGLEANLGPDGTIPEERL